MTGHDPDIPNLHILLEFLSPPSILPELGVIHTAVHPLYLHIASEVTKHQWFPDRIGLDDCSCSI